MKTELPESAKRYELIAVERARLRLARNDFEQAEAIADHYVSIATLALELKIIIDAHVRLGSSDTELAESVKYLVKEIKRAHLYDFGLPLEWKL